MKPNHLDVIITTVCEHPQVLFTIRSLHEELEGRVDHTIWVVDNFCNGVKSQGVERDKSSEHIREQAKLWPWLKYLEYDDKLSHWGAKRHGVESSDGEFLYFCDAHCIIGRDALFNMFEHYKENHEELNGSIHLPLTYHILEDTKLIYRLIHDLPKGVLHYKFDGFPKDKRNTKVFEVPAMSGCGLMLSRKIYDDIGGFPSELGIYGGGENFMNFALAVTGRSKWIYNDRPLYHHGDKRSYHFYAHDYFRNRIIALFTTCGQEIAERFVLHYNKMGIMQKTAIFHEAASLCVEQHKLIESKTTIPIKEWLEKWK